MNLNLFWALTHGPGPDQRWKTRYEPHADSSALGYQAAYLRRTCLPEASGGWVDRVTRP